MTDLLAGLEPALLWKQFEGLARIPRGSGKEAAAMAWAEAQARAAGCEVERDAAGNLLARKKATPGMEGRRPVALQGHIDMVCEKDEATAHDFEKDPIALVRDGDVLRARGTTLGADNGIGVAAGLALLAAKDVKHGPLEVLVTVDEETGLTGANAVKPGWLKAKILLNLDSEAEHELTIGCAGGIDTVAVRKITREPAPAGARALRLKVTGLKGGHSGIDIHLGRGNAIRVLASVLDALAPHDLALASLRGGNKRNAIPREASAVVLVAPAKEAALRADVARLAGEWRAALGQIDPEVAIEVSPAEAGPVMSAADARAAVGLLLTGPNGVEAMSPDVPGLVQTSTNLGVLETRDGEVECTFLTRSAIDSSKRALANRIAAACRLAGFDPRESGGYPGWKPEPGAGIVKLVAGVNQELFGVAPKVSACHAGLECGIIGEKFPGMEMVSFGPDIRDAHTPREQVGIGSTARFWRLLTTVLERI
ncbi:MAG: aminoacyl-histidine dipeptidase [Anaeromyxobacteraceae bacterium]